MSELIYKGDAMRIFLLLLSLLTLATPGFAGSMKTPIGYRGMCENKPELCRADQSVTAEASPIVYTKQFGKLLRELNQKWNARIKPITDEEKHREREVWEGAIDSGDCEEYAIAKKMELLSMGYSASQLLYALVISPHSRAGHLVLVVRTTQGNFVLDNEVQEVLLWEDTSYPSLRSHQRPEAPSFWANDPFEAFLITANL